MANDNKSLSHTKWNCKYHIVFAPKYRMKVFYGEQKVAMGNGSMSIKKTSKKSKERFFGLVWSEPLVMGMRAEGIVIAVNVVKNG